MVGQAGIRPNVCWNGNETQAGPNWKENIDIQEYGTFRL